MILVVSGHVTGHSENVRLYFQFEMKNYPFCLLWSRQTHVARRMWCRDLCQPHVITLVDKILPLSQFLNLTSLQVIRRDIARTYPEHEFFKKKDGVGQESLFNVMKAYSVHDRKWFKYHWHWYASKLNFTLYPFWKLNHPFVKYIKTQPKCSKYFALKWYLSCACREVGYCQGSAFIVGLLLMQVV